MKSRSWKTSSAGIGVLLSTIGTTLNQLTDGNSATNPDWNVVVPLLFTGLIGLFASDCKKSRNDSEAEGKP